MATTNSKVLILFIAVISVFAQDSRKCLEDQVTWFFNHVNKNPGALLDKRLQSRVIPLDPPYPFNIGLILSLSCDTNTTEDQGRSLGRYVVTQNVESKELVIFCMEAQQPERPKMMDEENWDPNEIRNRRMPVVLDVKQSNFSVTTTSTTTEEAIKDTSTASDKTIDSLYHSPGHVRVDQNEHSEHVHHSHQKLDSWLDYKVAFYFTLFLWLFSMLTLLLAWLTKSKCKESQGGDGLVRRRPNINEEEPAEEKDEALPALLSVSSSDQLNETVIHKKEDGNSSVIAVKTTPKSEKHHPDFYNHTPIAMSPHRVSSSHSPA